MWLRCSGPKLALASKEMNRWQEFSRFLWDPSSNYVCSDLMLWLTILLMYGAWSTNKNIAFRLVTCHDSFRLWWKTLNISEHSFLQMTWQAWPDWVWQSLAGHTLSAQVWVRFWLSRLQRLSHGSLIQADHAVRCTGRIRSTPQRCLPWCPRPTSTASRNSPWDCSWCCRASSSHDTNSRHGCGWWHAFGGFGSWHSLHAGRFQRSLQRHQCYCHLRTRLSAWEPRTKPFSGSVAVWMITRIFPSLMWLRCSGPKLALASKEMNRWQEFSRFLWDPSSNYVCSDLMLWLTILLMYGAWSTNKNIAFRLVTCHDSFRLWWKTLNISEHSFLQMTWQAWPDWVWQSLAGHTLSAQVWVRFWLSRLQRLSHGSLIQADHAVRCTGRIRSTPQRCLPRCPRPTSTASRNSPWDCSWCCRASSSHDTNSRHGCGWWHAFGGFGSWHSLHAGRFQRSLQRHQCYRHLWTRLS